MFASKYFDGPDGESPILDLVFDYVHNILVGTSLRRLDKKVIKGLNDDADYLITKLVMSRCPDIKMDEADHTDAELIVAIRQYFSKVGMDFITPRELPESTLAYNVDLYCELSALDEVDRRVFTFMIVLEDSSELKELSEEFGSNLELNGCSQIIGAAVNIQPNKVLDSIKGNLSKRGLINIYSTSYYLYKKVYLVDGLADNLRQDGLDKSSIISAFIPKAAEPQLDTQDFYHLETSVAFATSILKSAIEQNKAGINILFYGASGTGKSELAKIIAKDAGADLFSAGRADKNGNDPTASERVSSLLMGQWLVKDGRSVILFDELEDLFSWSFLDIFNQRATSKFSKQWFNDVLENNPVPTIWTSNRTAGIDVAFLRRFAYAIEFKPLNAQHRLRVLQRHIGEDGSITMEDMTSIAEKYAVSPAQIGKAVAVSKLMADEKPIKDSIESVLGAIEVLSGHERDRNPKFNEASYRLDALNSSADLIKTADRLTKWNPSFGGVSMCLYGPPGTGKTEYAKYISNRMAKKLLYRRASDILGMYVGQSEQQIAQAFREARDTDSILLFDEADSFMRDRSRAERSWEATMVNEFLQQLEASTSMVICTTNLWNDMDEAALRRFTLKVEFKFLKPEQSMTMFKSMFSGILAPVSPEEEEETRRQLSCMDNLALGDFAVVLKKEKAFGGGCSASDLVSSLWAEVKAKRTQFAIKKRPVGFGG